MEWIMAALLGVQGIPTEVLVAPMPAGFRVGYEAAQGGQSIEERVPAGESVEAWSRMITVQRLGGIASAGVHRVVERLGGMMARACPGATVSLVEDGVATASLRVDCPINPATSKPETMFARAFQGMADIHMVQYAYRAKADAAAAKVATAYLVSVHLRSGTGR